MIVTDGAEPVVVPVSVSVVNAPPTAVADAYEVGHGQGLTVAATAGLLANDPVWDADPLTVSLVGSPRSGTLSLGTDGAFTYTPNAGFVGVDSFTYRVSDGLTASGVATVTVRVTNATPAGPDRYFQTPAGVALTVAAAGGLLAGVSDADGDPLTAALASGPAFGTVVVGATGAFTYTPNTGFAGVDSFTYTVSDGLSVSAPVRVTVRAADRAPLAAGDAYLVAADGVLTVTVAGGLLANDRNDQPLTAEVVSGPAHGTLTLNADGSFSYTPATGYVGTDTFSYRPTDGYETGPATTVTLTVGSATVAAAADAAVGSRGPGGAITGNVLANDWSDGGTAALASGPQSGTLVLNPDGSFAYTPEAGFVGSDSFTYTVTDSAGTATGTVSLTVANARPTVAPDAVSVVVNGSLLVPASTGLLANDTDDDGDPLTASLASGPQHGTLTLNPDGGFAYTPDVGYVGPDSFTYTVSDGTDISDPVTVALTVAHPPPKPAADWYRPHHDVALTVGAGDGLLANDDVADGVVATVSVVTGPEYGTLTLQSDGGFTYTPDAGYVGPDAFTYSVTADGVTSAPVAVSLDIWNAAPRGTPNLYHVQHDRGLVVGTGRGVLANDVDHSSEVLTAELLSVPLYGLLVFAADGSFTYTPDAGYVGVDSFTYQVSDGVYASGPVTVSLDVWNITPGTRADAFRVHHGTPLSGGVLANDWDDDGDPLTVELASGPGHGTLALNPNGTFTYTPEAGYVGPDSFTYTVTDGPTLSAPVSVSIAVTNAAPVATPESYSIHRGGTLSGTVRANDWDADDDPVDVLQITGPAHGALALRADGQFTYTPAAGYVGADSFTYRLSDGAQSSDTVTVDIDVWNNAPRGRDQSYAVAAGTPLTTAAADGVLAGAADWDGDAVTAELVSGPSGGSLTFAADGSFTFTPTATFAGPTSFTYKVSDGVAVAGPFTATIDVQDRAPFAFDDVFRAKHGTGPVTGNVLTDDWDPEGRPLTAVLVGDQPAGGTVTIQSDGTFTFTPDTPQWVGIATFRYQASDGRRTSDVATATVHVQNTDPIGLVDTFRTPRGTTLTGKNVLTNDFDGDADTLTAELVGNALPTGAQSFTLNPDGTFTFVPASGYTGETSFSYIAKDGAGQSTPVLVTTSVDNAAPVGRMDTFRMPSGSWVTQLLPPMVTFVPGSLAINSSTLLANDYDYDHDTLTVSIASQPTYGTLTANGSGNWTYTAGLSGTALQFDTFTYTVSDGVATSDPVTVLITMTAPGLAAYDDAYRVKKGSTLTVPAATGVLANDWTSQAGSLAAQLISQPYYGKLSFDGTGAFTYTPNNPEFTGEDQFSYRLGESETAVARIKIVGLAAADDSYFTTHGRGIRGNVAGNDTRTTGEQFRVELVDGPSGGAFKLLPNGDFDFVPDVGTTGPVTFTYKVTNGTETSDPATVTIAVTNTAPTAGADSYTTPARVPLVVGGRGVLANDSDADGGIG